MTKPVALLCLFLSVERFCREGGPNDQQAGVFLELFRIFAQPFTADRPNARAGVKGHGAKQNLFSGMDVYDFPVFISGKGVSERLLRKCKERQDRAGHFVRIELNADALRGAVRLGTVDPKRTGELFRFLRKKDGRSSCKRRFATAPRQLPRRLPDGPASFRKRSSAYGMGWRFPE